MNYFNKNNLSFQNKEGKGYTLRLEQLIFLVDFFDFVKFKKGNRGNY